MRNPSVISTRSTLYLIKRWTYRLECSNLGFPPRIYKAILHVINGYAADRAVASSVCFLWNTFVGTIPGLEVQNGCPIVGEVLRKLASRTGGLIRESFLGIHVCIECVLYWSAGRNGKLEMDRTNSANNLVEMR
jgi:hypothetical protein